MNMLPNDSLISREPAAIAVTIHLGTSIPNFGISRIDAMRAHDVREGATADGILDSKTIPTAQVEPIELLRYGSPAIYGSVVRANVFDIIRISNFTDFAIVSGNISTGARTNGLFCIERADTRIARSFLVPTAVGRNYRDLQM